MNRDDRGDVASHGILELDEGVSTMSDEKRLSRACQHILAGATATQVHGRPRDEHRDPVHTNDSVSNLQCQCELIGTRTSYMQHTVVKSPFTFGTLLEHGS
jgi:hypothetical protein